MKLYHGTITTYEQSIREHGLLPDTHPLQIRWEAPGLASSDEKRRRTLRNSLNKVFTTTERTTGEYFARLRTAYSVAPNHTVLQEIDPHSPFGFKLVKATNHVDRSARPLLITIEVPDGFKWDNDPLMGGPSNVAPMFDRIPPEYITGMEHIPLMP